MIMVNRVWSADSDVFAACMVNFVTSNPDDDLDDEVETLGVGIFAEVEYAFRRGDTFSTFGLVAAWSSSLPLPSDDDDDDDEKNEICWFGMAETEPEVFEYRLFQPLKGPPRMAEGDDTAGRYWKSLILRRCKMWLMLCGDVSQGNALHGLA